MLPFIVNIASCSCTVIHYVIIPVLRDINTTLMSIFVSLAQDFEFFSGPVPKTFYILSAAYQPTPGGWSQLWLLLRYPPGQPWPSPAPYRQGPAASCLNLYFSYTFVVICVLLWVLLSCPLSVRIWMLTMVYLCFHFEFKFPGGLVKWVLAHPQRLT